MTEKLMVKKIGERDIVAIVRLLSLFALFEGLSLFFVWVCLGHFTWMSLLICSLSALVLAALCMYLPYKFGRGMGALLSGWTPGGSDPEGALLCEIHKIQHTKREGDFEQALRMVNNLLRTVPDYPEALYLKGRILWEGFENVASARACLVRVRQLTPEESQFHRWASGYMETLHQKE